MTADKQAALSQQGLIAAVIAYTLWGVMPAYFKWTDEVSVFEVLAHRIVWAVPFGALIIWARGQLRQVVDALVNAQTLGLLAISAVMIAVNWLVYVWAVQNNQIFQASLGYYINPLMYVVVGVVWFGEKLSRLQKVAVALAAIAVVALTVLGGRFPLIALFLAVSFTTYGVIRKRVEISAMPGLFIETLLLFLPALIYLLYAMNSGSASFGTEIPMSWILMLAGPITVLPLLCFAVAARLLPLSTVGFLQFIGPTLQFVLGVVFGEQLTLPYIMCFSLIWLAIIIYSIDLWQRNRNVSPGRTPYSVNRPE